MGRKPQNETKCAVSLMTIPGIHCVGLLLCCVVVHGSKSSARKGNLDCTLDEYYDMHFITSVCVCLGSEVDMVTGQCCS